MQGIQRVMQRMGELEQRFGSRTPGGESAFAQVLRQEENGTARDEQGLAAMVQAAARQQGVDPRLALAVAQCESGLDPNAVSGVGATGVMQLMPETARELGVTNPGDVQQNIAGGVKYLKSMLDRFQGDPYRAVAAYNAGPQAVQQHGGIPPYQETQEYVQRVMRMYQR